MAAEVAAGSGRSEELAAVLRLLVRLLAQCAPEDWCALGGLYGAQAHCVDRGSAVKRPKFSTVAAEQEQLLLANCQSP